jgi:hypothetical protein
LTPFVRLGGQSASAACSVLNATQSPIDVQSFQMIEVSGEVITELPAFSLAPGAGDSIGFSTNAATFAYCRVVSRGAAKSLRASILVNDSNGNTIFGFKAE